jgi:hypothetical protein
MRKYLALPVLVGASFALLYGIYGLVFSLFTIWDWVEELRFHIVGIHFGSFATFVVSLVLIAVGVAAGVWLRGTKEHLA